MNRLAKVSMLGTMLLALVLTVGSTRADPYGADAVTSFFNSLFNSFWPLIALLFVIGIILSVFTAPWWLKKVFGAIK